MASVIDRVKPINDFPDTPYEERAVSGSIKIRWINAQCLQVMLPDGKALMTDPFFPQNPRAKLWTRDTTPLLNLDDLGPVDYITISHSHFDHMDNLPDIFARCKPMVICDRIFAPYLSQIYKIPVFNIFPIAPGQSYKFKSFKLDTFQGRHNDLGDCADPDNMTSALMSDDNIPCYGKLNSFGTMFNTNFMFTLTNNFRIGFVSGVEIDTLAENWKFNGPNLLLRQKMIHSEPDDFAHECEALGGQIAIPMHHDSWFNSDNDMNAYCRDVNRLFHEHGTNMTFFNPKRLKWYTLSASISE